MLVYNYGFKKQTTSRKPTPPLFIGGNETEYSPGIHTWQELETNPLLNSPYIQGDTVHPAVNIESRAHHLTESLTAIGKANQREGFSMAASIEPHSTEIWGRYKAGTPKVVERATDNINSLYKDAKRQFWYATGFAALRASDLMPKAELDARANLMWTDFSRRFAGPPHRQSRDEFKAGLSRQITAQKRLKKQAQPKSISSAA